VNELEKKRDKKMKFQSFSNVSFMMMMENKNWNTTAAMGCIFP
jgi:hypothetical protein